MAEYIDREEFLKRIKPYDTPDKTDKALYNFALNKMMETPTVDAIPIPEGATNGDVIKAMFPNIESRLDEKTGIILVKWTDGTTKTFKASWWNTPFKKGVEE